MRWPLVLLFLASTLGATPAPVTLWFHGGTDDESASTRALIQRFNASQSQYEVVITKIRDDYFSSGSSFSYSSAVYAAALAGQLPDILDLDGPNLANYAWRGFLAPLDQVIPSSVMADLLPSVVQQGTYQGRFYALGQYDSGLAIVGRRSQLKKLGIRIPRGVADAWSLEEFQRALALIKSSGVAKVALDLKMNYGANEWYSYAFAPIVQGFGGDLIDRTAYAKTEGTLNGPASVKAVRFIKSLFSDKYARLDSTDEDFLNGTAALGFCGHWLAVDYMKALGEDFVLIPMPNWGKKAVTGMGSWAWSISKDAKNAAGAAAFLQFLTRPEEILKITQANGAIPGRKSMLATSELFRPGGKLVVFAQQLLGGVALPRPRTPAYPVITIAFYTALFEILNNGAEIQQALDLAAKRIDANIVSNGYYQD